MSMCHCVDCRAIQRNLETETDWPQLARDILNDDHDALIARLPEPIRSAFTDARAEKKREAGQ